MWGQKKPDLTCIDARANLPTGCLGSSLRVKGDISGTEDLLIDGSVEGMIQLDAGKLTVRTRANLKADINAREVVVYGGACQRP
jgi:cytoskeletal protein CcmA (bactofilin family)